MSDYIHSATTGELVDLIPALRQSDCWIPNWFSAKAVHSSSTNHGWNYCMLPVIFPVIVWVTCPKQEHMASNFWWHLYFKLVLSSVLWHHLHIFCNVIQSKAYHLLYITWLRYFESEGHGSWVVACWLWRRISTMTSLAAMSSCVVSYENADGDEQQ